MMAYFATSTRTASDAISLDTTPTALRLVEALWRFFVDPKAYHIVIEDGADRVDVTFESGMVSVDGGCGASTCVAVLGAPRVCISQALLHVAKAAKRKCRPRMCRYSQMMLLRLVQVFSDSVEVGRVTSDKWVGTSHMALQPLVRSGSRRTRNINPMFKLIVSKDIGAEPKLRSPQQYFASLVLASRGGLLGRGLCASAKRRFACGAKPSTGRNFSKDNMLQYLAATRRPIGKCQSVQVVLDGVHVNNRELLNVGIVDTERGVSAWLPPQDRGRSGRGGGGGWRLGGCKLRVASTEVAH